MSGKSQVGKALRSLASLYGTLERTEVKNGLHEETWVMPGGPTGEYRWLLVRLATEQEIIEAGQ